MAACRRATSAGGTRRARSCWRSRQTSAANRAALVDLPEPLGPTMIMHRPGPNAWRAAATPSADIAPFCSVIWAFFHAACANGAGGEPCQSVCLVMAGGQGGRGAALDIEAELLSCLPRGPRMAGPGDLRRVASATHGISGESVRPGTEARDRHLRSWPVGYWRGPRRSTGPEQGPCSK